MMHAVSFQRELGVVADCIVVVELIDGAGHQRHLAGRPPALPEVDVHEIVLQVGHLCSAREAEGELVWIELVRMVVVQDDDLDVACPDCVVIKCRSDGRVKVVVLAALLIVVGGCC